MKSKYDLGSNPSNASLPSNHWTYRVERKARGEAARVAERPGPEIEEDELEELVEEILEAGGYVHD